MKKVIVFMLAALIFVLFISSVAFAGNDWEFSSRHFALAGTGNAIFNLKGLSPSLENIACLVGSPQFNILQEGSASAVNMINSHDDVDYYHRLITGSTGLKTTYPTIQKDDEDDFAERLAIGFVPGVFIRSYYRSMDYTENDDEEFYTLTHVQFFQRLGIAYGINEIVAVGVGFTLVPPTIIRSSLSGQKTVVDGFNETTEDPQETFTTYAPLLFSPELGVLVRPVEFIQLGLAMEAGDLKTRRSDVTHTFADGDEDIKTEAIFARSPSLGFGFAIMVPDVEKFMVGFDLDSEWRRGEASDYGFYADNQKIEWSVSVEKMFEMSSIKGGLGYADEVGTKRYLPYDRFFVSFGTDLYFDEHIMMGLAFRGETGYFEAVPKGGLGFGGGFAWTFGGSF